MKIRNGFVSNSSSSSFIIKKANLTEHQILQIKNYRQEAERLGRYSEIEEDSIGKFGWIDDEWSIIETEDIIWGCTIIDNFDFAVFLDAIGVDEKVIEWGGDSY